MFGPNVTPRGWLGVECRESFNCSSPLHADIFGISDHDLMFSQENPDDEMEEQVEETPAENMPAVTAQHQDYILHRVSFLSLCLCDCPTPGLHLAQGKLSLSVSL